jgi:hypothetical protein
MKSIEPMKKELNILQNVYFVANVIMYNIKMVLIGFAISDAITITGIKKRIHDLYETT